MNESEQQESRNQWQHLHKVKILKRTSNFKLDTIKWDELPKWHIQWERLVDLLYAILYFGKLPKFLKGSQTNINSKSEPSKGTFELELTSITICTIILSAFSGVFNAAWLKEACQVGKLSYTCLWWCVLWTNFGSAWDKADVLILVLIKDSKKGYYTCVNKADQDKKDQVAEHVCVCVWVRWEMFSNCLECGRFFCLGIYERATLHFPRNGTVVRLGQCHWGLCVCECFCVCEWVCECSELVWDSLKRLFRLWVIK